MDRRSPRRRRVPSQRARRRRRVTQVKTLLPVMRPAQNMREIIKQCIMLEDHLVQSKKRCPDCTSKHMLAIEALAEECGSLCGAGHCETAKQAQRVAQQARVLHHAWAANPKDEKTCRLVASKLRTLRKHLMKEYAVLPAHALPTNEQHAIKRVIKNTQTKARVSRQTKARVTQTKTRVTQTKARVTQTKARVTQTKARSPPK